MPNCLEYVRNSQIPLKGKNFKEADAIVLNLLSYLHFEAFKDRTHLKDMVSKADAPAKDTRVPELNKQLLVACGQSRRFAHVRIYRYASETDLTVVKQFAAVTFFIDWRTIYVAYRGTDGTIVGWQEDFNLAFMDEVPAQAQAKEYLRRLAKKYFWCRIIVGGHSKGGNLAVYAGMSQPEKYANRIKKIYNLDGPGFKKAIYDSPLFKAVRPKVTKIVPEYSVIGMLLQDDDNYVVVKSGGTWLLQHDMYNWQIDADSGDLLTVPAINPEAARMNKMIFNWLNGIDESKRAIICESLFAMMKATDCTTVSSVFDNWKSHVGTLLSQYRQQDKESRVILRKSLLGLVKDITLASLKNRGKADRKATKTSGGESDK